MKSILLLFTVCCFSIINASAQTDTSQSHYITTKVEIPQLKRERNIQVYLPADYYKSSKKYPVIYMQDAQNIYNKDGQNKRSWCVDSLLKTLPDARQAIIVGIEHGGKNRIAEYSPYPTKYGDADGVAYTEFMVKNLKPYIDSHYRTKSDARNTAIAGSSMGGLIALYATVKYPKVFGVAGVFSPSLWIAPAINQFVNDSPVPATNRFFVACGDKEGNETEYVAKMDTLLLSKKGFSRKNVPAPLVLKGEQHNEHQWMLEFPVFYKWFIDGL